MKSALTCLVDIFTQQHSLTFLFADSILGNDTGLFFPSGPDTELLRLSQCVRAQQFMFMTCGFGAKCLDKTHGRVYLLEKCGMLIHGAIIAREYGLPCVTGIPDADRIICTGNQITVDGYLGIVTINRGAK